MTGLFQIANKFITCLTAQAAFERQGWLLVERRFFFSGFFFFWADYCKLDLLWKERIRKACGKIHQSIYLERSTRFRQQSNISFSSLHSWSTRREANAVVESCKSPAQTCQLDPHFCPFSRHCAHGVKPKHNCSPHTHSLTCAKSRPGAPWPG